jgi:PAS domain S-box-containing protein
MLARVPTDIASIAAEQRAVNARRITLTLGLLSALATPVAFLLGAPVVVTSILSATTLANALAYWLTRTGRSVAGVLVAGVTLLAEHVGVVGAIGELGAVPYISPLVILLVAATTSSRWLWPAFGLTLAALGVEARLSLWQPADHGSIFTASLFAVVVFVVSMLHVRGTELAFALAEKRDRARAAAAKAAAESERQYRLIADNTNALIALVKSDGTALYLSPSHSRILHVDPSKVLGERPLDHLAIENVAEAGQAFIATLADGEAHVELKLTRPDGEKLRLDTSMRRLDADGEHMVVIVSRDVTQKRLLEQRVIASERLEALGRLAGSIAHDFNNLLTVMGGAADLARGTLPDGHAAHRELDTVLGATSTATRLTRQLLTFSRRQLTVPVQLDPKHALEDQRELLERMVGKRIRLRYDFAPDVPNVMMSESHFEQLAMNLVVNGRDAMPGGGCLTLGLRARRVATRGAEALAPGEYLEFSVADEGTGIAAEILPQLFDPFFTTKGESGTGLGLATCHSVASQLGGTIEIETALGKGSTFRVLLPASTAVAAKPVVTQSAPVSVHRVLVVDDERAVRETTARMLQASGYQALTAATLADARQMIADPSLEFEALITDVVLSGERGTDLLEHCRKLRPNTRILVMSGFTPEPSAALVLSAHGAGFLAKPFGRDQLLKALKG